MSPSGFEARSWEGIFQDSLHRTFFWLWIQIRISESNIHQGQNISNLAKPLCSWHRTFAWWHNVWPRWVPVERWSSSGSMAVVYEGVSFANVEPGYGPASKWSLGASDFGTHLYSFLKRKLQVHWMEPTFLFFCSKNRRGWGMKGMRDCSPTWIMPQVTSEA